MDRGPWCRLLGEGVAFALRSPREVSVDRLYAVEAEAIAHAVPARRLEMAAGRDAAREALAALGAEPCPIPKSGGGAPRWPGGFVGSITHTGSLCAAVVARASVLSAIGVDAEPAAPLDRELLDSIATHAELSDLDRLPPADAALRARWIFCAKEAAYKCQYPLSGLLLDFGDLEIGWTDVSNELSAFEARYRRDAPPFRRGDRIPGLLAQIEGHVVTVAKLRNRP